HVSGATPLAALDPHERRFGLHPLQTFTRARGPEQLDSAWAAVTAESAEAWELGFELARLLGLEPFELDDAARPLYHAGAVLASAGEGEVGLVPTMGAYHGGHVALLRAARDENDLVVVTLFVNPAQFDSGDDLAAYPRDEERDARIAAEEGTDILFAPAVE